MWTFVVVFVSHSVFLISLLIDLLLFTPHDIVQETSGPEVNIYKASVFDTNKTEYLPLWVRFR